MSDVVDALERIEAYLEELSDFVDLVRRGMRYPDKVKGLGKLLDSNLPIKKSKRQSLRASVNAMTEVAERAQRHIGGDFAYLFGLATVQLWTILEATMNDLCVALLEHDERWRTMPAIGNLKVKVAEFVGLSQRQQIEHLFEAAMNTTGARYEPGIARYETFLRAAGLGGEVDPAIRKRLLWLAETRHLLVHRQGVVDAKYAERCPWSSPIVGTKVKLSGAQFNEARNAVRGYVHTIGIRLETAGLAPEASRLISARGARTDRFRKALARTSERLDTKSPPIAENIAGAIRED